MAAAAKRVLVTRPEPGNAQTANRLAQQDHIPVCLPFTHIVALDHHVGDIAVDAVVATSANALRHLEKSIIARFCAVPFHGVGDATAAMAGVLGFHDVRSARGSVSDLARHLTFAHATGGSILYACGAVRKTDLEDIATDAGFQLHVCETYSIEKVSQLTDKLTAIFRDQPPDAVMFHSGVSAQIFADWAAENHVAQHFENTTFIVISDRVAQMLGKHLDGQIMVAKHPDEASMQAALLAALS